MASIEISTARACNLYERVDATVDSKGYAVEAVTKYLVLRSSGSGSIWRVEALRCRLDSSLGRDWRHNTTIADVKRENRLGFVYQHIFLMFLW